MSKSKVIAVNVKENLSTGKWTFVDEETQKRKKKSEIWSYFYRVRDSESKELVPLAFCKNCDDFYQFPPGCSPTNLKGHKCYLERQVSVDGPSSAPPSKKKKITEGIKKDVLNGCVSFAAEDMRSFEIVTGSGFKKMAAACVRAGVALKSYDFDIDDILPHPTTISRKIQDRHESDLKKLVADIRPRIDAGECSASMDLWTDKHSNKNFLTFNVCFLDSKWVMQSRNLFTIQMYTTDDFGMPKPKSAENIAKAVENKLKDIGLEGRLRKFTYVTDQGSNLIKMCSDQNVERIDCAAHVINTVLANVFSEPAMKKDAPHLHRLLVECKSLVEFMKKSSLQEMLSSRLKQHCRTRWNTHVEMLYSVAKNYDEILTLLCLRKRNDLLDNISVEALQRLIEFLKPFKKATQFLEGDYATIQQVMFKVKELTDHVVNFLREEEKKEPIEEHDELSEELKWMATRCKAFLETKFRFTDFHKAAAFLWPACRQLLYLTAEEKADAHAAVRKLLPSASSTCVSTSTASTSTASTSTASTSTASSPCHSSEGETDEHTTDISSTTSTVSSNSSVSDFLQRFRDVPPTDQQRTPIEQEINTYTVEYEADINNVLGWWREHSGRFPGLSALARRVLAVPATSAASERVFSRGGRIFEDRRASLSNDSFAACMFVSYNS